ncbi:MAG: deoxyribodipyrimidine photo-lyase [Acidimicrobiales bacterium]|nr:deoxyribodipyrimidine photo-lyase [Acidimicrobiales bacterium]
MHTIVVLFNRVLRLHDHPALATALRRAERVVPLFVVDPAIVEGSFGAPNRLGFLAESLVDLRGQLRGLGADLVVRRGDPVHETLAVARSVGATAVHVTDDVSAFAAARQRALCAAAALERVEVSAHPGIGIVEAGAVTPTGGDHFKVFTPYFRAWSRLPRRPLAARPRALRLPDGIDIGPEIDDVLPPAGRAGGSPQRPPGGETAGRAAFARWKRAGGPAGYEDGHDALAADRTSRLSPYLHFGCLSPLELAARLGEEAGPGGEAFTRQLCWRDFYHQVTAAFPAIARRDYRSRSDRWSEDEEAVEAWRTGRTGYPIVDAGMRQLLAEGWMHNRARMITASFLIKDLGVDWRIGAAHFLHWLCDGDIAQNSANWQWTAGTGNDTRPNRVFNPLRQAERFDPEGDYVRRWVPELAGLDDKVVHRPWALGAERPTRYPPPIVEHERAAEAFRARRAEQQRLAL